MRNVYKLLYVDMHETAWDLMIFKKYLFCFYFLFKKIYS